MKRTRAKAAGRLRCPGRRSPSASRCTNRPSLRVRSTVNCWCGCVGCTDTCCCTPPSHPKLEGKIDLLLWLLVLGGREWWNRQTPKWGEKINQHDHAWKTGRIKIWYSGSLPRLLKPIHNSRGPALHFNFLAVWALYFLYSSISFSFLCFGSIDRFIVGLAGKMREISRFVRSSRRCMLMCNMQNGIMMPVGS